MVQIGFLFKIEFIEFGIQLLNAKQVLFNSSFTFGHEIEKVPRFIKFIFQFNKFNANLSQPLTYT